jgi:hypothetical protein
MAFSTWFAVHQPGAAAQATITKAAPGAGIRRVVTGFTVSIACGATAQTPVAAELLNGAAQIWVGQLSAPINTCASITQSGLDLAIDVNQTVTLRFAAAGVAASLEAVALHGYDLQQV